jgi:hypothetical protein
MSPGGDAGAMDTLPWSWHFLALTTEGLSLLLLAWLRVTVPLVCSGAGGETAGKGPERE